MIIRREHRANFTTIANAVVDDKNLSYEALGLLTYLLSRPDDWQVRVEQLRQRKSVRGEEVGRDQMYRIVGELRGAGYLRYVPVYEDGKVASAHYIIRETPVVEAESESVATAGDLLPPEPETGDLLPIDPLPANLNPVNPHVYKRLTGTKDSKKPKGERDAHAQEAGDNSPADAAFARLKPQWPVGALDDVEAARAAWAHVPEAELEQAANFVPQFVRLRREAGRTKSVSLKTYITSAPWRSPQGEQAKLVATVELKAWSRALWCRLWRNVEKRERVERTLAHIRQGVKLRPEDVPAEAVEKLLTPNKTEDDHAQLWAAYCEKLGFDMPDPPTGIVFLPAAQPPIMRLRHRWKGYALLTEKIVPVGSKAWWWRAFSEGAPLADLIREARTTKGSVRIDMGPFPSSVELDAMQEVQTNSADFAEWRTWFRKREADLGNWPDASIWTLTPRPVRQREPA